MAHDLTSVYSGSYLRNNKGAPAESMADSIRKLTGNEATDYKMPGQKMGQGGGFSHAVAPPVLNGMRAGKAVDAPVGASPGGFGAIIAQKQAQEAKATQLNAAYEAAIKGHLYTQDRNIDEAKMKELGSAGFSETDPNIANYWVRMHNNLTNADEYAKDSDEGGRYAKGLKGNWDRNQVAWQTGIGAVTGLLTGGPVGLALGAATGAERGYESKRGQDRAYEQMKQGNRALNQANLDTQSLAEQLRRRRVNRSAGEAAATYETQSPSAGTDIQNAV